MGWMDEAEQGTDAAVRHYRKPTVRYRALPKQRKEDKRKVGHLNQKGIRQVPTNR